MPDSSIRAVLRAPGSRASTRRRSRVPLPFVDPRIDPEPSADERVTLTGFLDWYRLTMVTKIDGLTDEQARTRFVGSDTSLLGLIRHLTEVERELVPAGACGARGRTAACITRMRIPTVTSIPARLDHRRGRRDL